jgi:hypothetical protein
MTGPSAPPTPQPAVAPRDFHLFIYGTLQHPATQVSVCFVATISLAAIFAPCLYSGSKFCASKSVFKDQKVKGNPAYTLGHGGMDICTLSCNKSWNTKKA